MYTVFKIYGPNSKSVYIGFCTTDAEPMLSHFLNGGNRTESDRADVRFVAEHGGASNLQAVELECGIEDMPAAVESRNRYRTNEMNVFSGPTMFPLAAYASAVERNPAGMAQMFTKWKARLLPTARAAYETGALWTFDQIKDLISVHGRDSIKANLATMTPDTFAELYDLG